MALQIPIWPWYGLRWAVGCFSPFWEVGLFPSNLGSHLECVVRVEYDYEVLVRDSSYC
jgi:hypothetical protein